jgi:anaerobic selenocysteine-containing dehydrogenase
MKAFSKIRFKVVVEQFMTDTASIADVILPAKNMFEQTDIIGSYWSPYVQLKPKITNAPGEVLPESEIYFNLAQRLRLNTSVSSIPEPGNSNIEEWLDNRIKGYSPLCLDDLRSGPVLAPGLQEIAYDDFRFTTRSGKIELYSEEASEKWKVSPLPKYTPIPHDSYDSHTFLLLTPNTGSRIHSQFGNLKVIIENSEKPAILFSPSDAESLNIRTGTKVKIFNHTGQLSAEAGISNRIPEGVIMLPNGIWLNEGGGGNFLIASNETDMGFGAAFHDNLVRVEIED